MKIPAWVWVIVGAGVLLYLTRSRWQGINARLLPDSAAEDIYMSKGPTTRSHPKTKELIAGEEGLRLEVYQDPGAGKAWTIGYGHKVQPGEKFHPYGTVKKITQAEADALFEADTHIATSAVEKYVRVPLTANQQAALISFVFNVGTAAFAGSTLLKLLNAGKYAEAAAELPRWNKDNGVVLQILVNRRAREKDLFLA